MTRPTNDAKRKTVDEGAGSADEPMDVNVVMLGGVLATDAEFREYESGAVAMRFLLTIRTTQPRRRVDVIPVTVWDPAKRLVRRPPVKGQRIWFLANVHRRFWDSGEGRRSRIEVVAHTVDLKGDRFPREHLTPA